MTANELKLLDLAHAHNYDTVEEFMSKVSKDDALVPAICISDSCSYERYVPRTLGPGLCPHCNAMTVTSCLTLVEG
jgi:hypothetical protein